MQTPVSSEGLIKWNTNFHAANFPNKVEKVSKLVRGQLETTLRIFIGPFRPTPGKTGPPFHILLSLLTIRKIVFRLLSYQNLRKRFADGKLRMYCVFVLLHSILLYLYTLNLVSRTTPSRKARVAAAASSRPTDYSEFTNRRRCSKLQLSHFNRRFFFLFLHLLLGFNLISNLVLKTREERRGGFHRFVISVVF